jgi:hypothetical protein
MITNEFFKGYFQALNMTEDIVRNLIDHYSTTNNQDKAVDGLEAALAGIRGVRTSYQELVVQLNRNMNGQK